MEKSRRQFFRFSIWNFSIREGRFLADAATLNNQGTSQMLAYLIAATLFIQSPTTPTRQPSEEQFGAWSVRVTVNPITDEVSVGGYLGDAAENIAIACAENFPDSTLVFWRSSTRFRETGFVPRTASEISAFRMPVGNTTYRFDQDAPVTAYSTVLESYSTRFGGEAVDAITSRISTSSRLVVRDAVNESHTAVFNLVPSDTLGMLRRLDEICGTTYASETASTE